MPIYMKEIVTTDPMVILREKGRRIFPRNLILTEVAYYTIRTCTVLPLQEINTAKSNIKRRRMVRINNSPGKNYGCRQNPDSSSGIYMNLLKEDK